MVSLAEEMERVYVVAVMVDRVERRKQRDRDD